MRLRCAPESSKMIFEFCQMSNCQIGILRLSQFMDRFSDTSILSGGKSIVIFMQFLRFDIVLMNIYEATC